MEQVIKLTDFALRPQKEDVLRMMELKEDSPIYEEVLEEYEELKETLAEMCSPAILIRFGTIPESGERAAFVLSTVGEALGEYSTKQFQEGDCLKGMLADAAADSMLFQLERPMQEALKELCAERGVGISRRMEAPIDMPMERQMLIFEQTEAERELGMGISSGYMFRPVKSQGIIFLLTEDPEVFRSQHDCGKCPRLDCPLRKKSEVCMTVQDGERKYRVQIRQGQSVMEALTEHGQYFEAVCGGNGRCGKCGIRLLAGELAVTAEDRHCFSEEELTLGYRLSCRAYPEGDLCIELAGQKETAYAAVAEYGSAAKEQEGREQPEEEYGVAIDIGTTTIAMQLVALKSGASKAVHTGVNRQRRFGADVISRIQAACAGKAGALRESIREDLRAGIARLTEKANIGEDKLTRAVLAGNTTMIHLLMGYDCSGLGVYPFTPVSLSLIETDLRELLGESLRPVPAAVLPGISTYVGGDIASGILQCGMDVSGEVSLLVDLGTNGEMALGNASRILTASTAAGPAFEGGNIRWGCGSVAGAISRVAIEEDQVSVETIGGAAPAGICGTGVVETAAELARLGLVDETGLLDDEYFDEGYPLAKTASGETIVFTQQDVREIQLAKAAVRAGIETLLLRYGIRADEVENLYIAGGFGFQLDAKKAAAIGMLPPALVSKARAAGNTSLGGAVRYLLDESCRERIVRLTQSTGELNLSGDKDFNRIYMEQMMFGEET